MGAVWRSAYELYAHSAGALTAGLPAAVVQPAYDQAEAVFGTRGVADMLFLIGAYQTVCGILNTLLSNVYACLT